MSRKNIKFHGVTIFSPFSKRAITSVISQNISQVYLSDDSFFLVLLIAQEVLHLPHKVLALIYKLYDL
jgi:hypothetical protein